jgi:hypothetical protein
MNLIAKFLVPKEMGKNATTVEDNLPTISIMESKATPNLNRSKRQGTISETPVTSIAFSGAHSYW